MSDKDMKKIKRLASGFVIVADEIGKDVATDMLSLVIEMVIDSDQALAQRLAEDTLFVESVTRVLEGGGEEYSGEGENPNPFEQVLVRLNIARGME